MLLDVEQTNHGLLISYFDDQGKVKIKKYNIKQYENWSTCSPNDPKRSKEFTNWDGSSVKKIKDRRFNKWSIYEFIRNLNKADKDEICALNFPEIYSIDIETEIIDNFPNPEIAKERITTIAISNENNETIVLGWKPLTKAQQDEVFQKQKDYLKDFGDWTFRYICFDDEYNMMATFIEKMLPKLKFVTGWNYFGFDWKYIYNRCLRLGIDVTKASPSRKVHGNDNIPMHIGMICYMEMYKKWDRTVKIKEGNSLDFVSGAVLGVKKIKYDGTLQDLYEKDYEKYVLYNAIDAALVVLMHKKIRTAEPAFTVSNLCNLSIYKSSSAVNLTEALLWSKYYENGMVVGDPKMETPRGSYEGAYVKEPEPGMFSAATCFDFASLYPSIMRQNNISPESFIKKTNNSDELELYNKQKDKYVVSVNGAIYDNTKDSILKKILTELYTERKVYKDKHLKIELLLSKIKK